MSYQKKRVNSVDSEAIELRIQCIRLRDFFKIACYRSEWLGCRFLFLPAHSIYGFSKKLDICTIKKISLRRGRLCTRPSNQKDNSFFLRNSNSCWVIAPISRSFLYFRILSAISPSESSESESTALTFFCSILFMQRCKSLS